MNIRQLRLVLAGAAAIVLIAAQLTGRTAAIAGEEALYRAQAAVTGQGQANRIIGFGSCLEDVLIKVSGAQKLAHDNRLPGYKRRAATFVTAFTYHDQMSGKPTRDEQGTRDRPYDLIVDFDRHKVDGALRALGLEPWVSHRPVLSVFIEMRQPTRAYILAADSDQTAIQREALLAAAAKRGMSIALPSAATLAKSNVDGTNLLTIGSSSLAPIVAEQDGAVALVGQLVWDDRKLGWATRWWIDWQGRSHRWQLFAVTFDEAFRQGVGGAAQILSGNGDPA